jgi:hypothetical protein
VADGIPWVIIVNGFGLTGISKFLGPTEPFAESLTHILSASMFAEHAVSSPVLVAEFTLMVPEIKPELFKLSPEPDHNVPVSHAPALHVPHVYGGIPPIACNEYE